MATIGTLITASNFNSVLTSVTSILSTYYGGSVTAQTVVAGETIASRDNWANLQADLDRCLIHQTNNGTAYAAPTSSTVITAAYVNSLTNSAASVWDNKESVGSNQLLPDTVNGISTRSTTWADDLQHQVQSYWPSANDAAYFFRQGGYIKPVISRNTGWTPGTENTAWANLIDSVLADPNYVNYKYTLDEYEGTIAPYTKTDGSNSITIQFTRNNSQLITTDVIFNPLVTFLAIDVLPTSTVYNYYSTDSLGGTLAPRPSVQSSISLEAGGALITKTLTYDFVSPVTFNALGSTTTTVTLNNTGNSDCTVTGITFGAQSGSGLSATVSTSTFIVPTGGSANFDITISGSTQGSYINNTITIASNNDGGSVQIPIAATVIAPIFAVAVTPASISSTVTNYNAVYTSFLFNTGATGTIKNVAAALSNSTNFSVATTQPGLFYYPFSGFFGLGGGGFITIPAGASLTFTPPKVPSASYSTNVTLTFTPEDTTQSTAQVVVPVSYTTNVVTQHLGDWISAKNYYNGVIGFSYDIIEGIRTLTVGFGMAGDSAPQAWPGGAKYASAATLGVLGDTQQSLGIPLYSYTNGAYSSFLNQYGSWTNPNGGSGRAGSFTNTYNFTVPNDNTYFWTYSSDNYGSIYIDGFLRGSLGNLRSWTQGSIYLSAGSHTITLVTTNQGGPGSVAATISATSDWTQNVYWSTRTPVRTTPAYQYWAEVYRIPLTSGAVTYQSSNYIVKKTDFAAGTNYGTYATNGNLCTVKDDGYGNLDITVNLHNGNYTGYDDVNQTITNFQYLPYYYSEAEPRVNQLESPVSGKTKYFLGFNNQGAVRTSLVTFPSAPAPVYFDYGGGTGDVNGDGFGDTSDTSLGGPVGEGVNADGSVGTANQG